MDCGEEGDWTRIGLSIRSWVNLALPMSELGTTCPTGLTDISYNL